MTSVAAKASLACWESSYQALSRDGNPRFATVLNVLEALDFRLYPMMGGREACAPGGRGEAGWPGGSVLPCRDLFVLVGDSLPESAQ